MFVNFSMYKLLPIFLIAFGFTETMEVYYKTDTPIAGFQFNVEGVKVIDAFSGDAETEGFTIAIGNNTILGFSLIGGTIPAGDGSLLFLNYGEDNTNALKLLQHLTPAICLHGLVVSDPNGMAIDYQAGECWFH